MRGIGYFLVKLWIKAALYLYHGKILVHGLENVPVKGPVLFLPNHQNALIDVLLIAVDCNRKPYFLTRSDVFKGKFLRRVFHFFQMIPIYRIRDGRDSLKNNQAIFDYCSELLIKNKALLMFPEANHNLKRRVRPLSKGFTRILFHTMDKAPETEIQIVPVGINYKNATSFPDKVALYFGTPIAVNAMYNPEEEKESVILIKEAVSSRLKNLTTHIANEENYDETLRHLDAVGVDYLKPQMVNSILEDLPSAIGQGPKAPGFLFRLLNMLFALLNFPLLIMWRTFVKPNVWEPEFMGTLRFTFALMVYPFYYLLLFTTFALSIGPTVGLAVTIALFVFNWVYTRSK